MDNNIDNMSVNETDPRLKFDAFTAGVKDGGLRSTTIIQILVCYIINALNGKVTAEHIVNATDEGMLVNHFEISDAISKLIKSGTVIEDENGMLKLNNISQSDIDLIEHDLPKSVREKSIHLCQRIIAKETYQRENKVDIVKIDNGYNVVLHVSDKDNDFMTLNLFATSYEQAEMIKDKFITDPIKVYETLINAIFDN